MTRRNPPMYGTLEALTFMVGQYDERGNRERILAAACDVRMARGAYEVAVGLYPERRIMLSQGMHVVRKNWEGE